MSELKVIEISESVKRLNEEKVILIENIKKIQQSE